MSTSQNSYIYVKKYVKKLTLDKAEKVCYTVWVLYKSEDGNK